MFNAHPVVQRIALGDAAVCVIDDALQAPERWVELAQLHAGSFVEAPGNAYPGVELPMPESIVAQCMAYFDQHLCEPFGLRGSLRGHAKLAIATYPEERLRPFQTIPHVDSLRVESGLAVMASVLYLFQDANLGGTSFYRPRVEAGQLAALFEDAARLDSDAFRDRHGLPRRYPADSAWFEHVLTVPPRWNRLIVYAGTIFHSSHIPQPSRLDASPETGRLTLNGFFTCQRGLAARAGSA